MYPIIHSNGRADIRYAISNEYCGSEFMVYVVRFCGDWLASFDYQSQAIDFAIKHNKERLEKL